MELQKVDKYYKKASYYKQHPELSLEEWQYALRKKFAEINPMGIENIGDSKVFSDFRVSNSDNRSKYKVSIRSLDNSENFCSCFDFKTNHLGTCKHIEAVLHQLRSDPKTKEKLEHGMQRPYSSIYLDYRNGRQVKIRIGTEHTDKFYRFAKKYFDNNQHLKPQYFSDFYSIIEEGRAISDTFKCYPDVIDYIVEQRDSELRQEFVSSKYSGENGQFKSLIQTELFPYQKEGVRFIAKAGRSLLADDMGLGKTIQAIAACELLKKEAGIERVLIICPTSLKYQWQSEIEKFTGSSVYVIEGLPDKRPAQYRGEEFYKIVSYHTASNDLEHLKKHPVDLVILDEAQRIKNFRTKTSRNIKKIPFSYSIVLTGTPLENKLEELYSIIQFLDPFILGPFHAFLNKHQVKNDTGKIIGYKDLNEIGIKLSGLMLRRKKKEVLNQLPERIDKILLVPMTDSQMGLHEEYQSVVAKLVNKWKRLGFLPENDRKKLIISLNMMRMSCDSTYIIDQETRHDTKIDELMSILDEIFAEGDDKVVVFSQWERMTRIVSRELDKRGVKYEYLHGGVPSTKRQNLFENFNNDPETKVFLSTDAGGTGLNLQAASYLVNLDIPWNPAVLEQRIARIHRLGQKKSVNIINMVSSGTIEHRMIGVIKFKSALAEGILDSGEDTIFMGESKFKKFMNVVDNMVPGGEEKETPEKVEGGVVEEDEIRDEHYEEQKQGKEKSGETGEPVVDDDTFEPDKEPVQQKNKQEKESEPEQEKIPGQKIYSDKETAPEKQDISGNETAPGKEPEPGDVIKTGVNFLGQLSEILSDKEKTQKLVSSMVAKDKKDGKTYLKIPVENEKTVENVFTMIGAFMKGVSKESMQ